MEKQRFVLTLDLLPDPQLIAEYEAHHRSVWPEIEESLLAAGITQLEIYRLDTRLCMILEADASFTFAQKAILDADNPIVQRWEMLMWDYQQALPTAKPGEKWVVMNQIYRLEGLTGVND